MSLRFALLATLSAGPRTGYDLLRIFDSSVGFVWHAPHTQIYPELRRMEADGWLSSREVPRGPKGVKREYAITDAGRAELRRQASEITPPSPEKDPYRLKAAYLEFAEPAAARAQFEAHVAHYEAWRDTWADLADSLRRREYPLLADRLAATPPEQHELAVAAKVFAYEGLTARAEMEIAWATRGLELLDRLGTPAHAAPARRR